ncbi:MAG: exo-alpha-sialidase, partial [Gammaproteobacteria bacterium]|nr:exo-alpha-sialidase [Gammaproteobacteria bacterium]
LNRHIRKVGNPTIHIWPDGALGVFYVSVSIGGWGASAINYIESGDLGSTWTDPRRLVTSPFLNISTLVRTPPVQLQDGSIELPVYHEFIGKFSESLHVARDITVIDKRRISWGTYSLQPSIAPINERQSIALQRYAGEPPGRVLSSTSLDTGINWSSPERLSLPNPNSAVALLNTGDGHLLLALNDTEDGRNRLSLATQKVGEDTWHIIRTIEEEVDTENEEFEFSYPSLAIDAAGDIHLVYTWNQSRIRHLRFNRAWLKAESS